MSQADDEYRRRASRLLEGVDLGPRHVLTITDAELLALDDPGKPRITPLLGLGPTVSDRQRRLAADEAARRLFTAQRTEDGTPLGGPDSSAGEPTVHTVLRMRRSWLGVLMIDQNAEIGRQFVTVYLRADGRAMTEFVTHDGHHHFTVLTRAAALDAAAEILTPFAEMDDRDGPGGTYPIAVWQRDATQLLANAKVVSTVVSRRQDRSMRRRVEDRLAAYNFDDRTEILHTETPGQVWIRPVARRTLRRHLDDITRPLDLERDERNG